MKNLNRIVIKIGSHLISKSEVFLEPFCEQVKELRKDNCEVIIVSSGAIFMGVVEYNIKNKPKKITEKQAFASIGQPLLMRKYIEEFRKLNIKVAQILLTSDDFDNRERYLNIKNVLNYLLKIGVVPIINENDTVANEEIKLGDNDKLSAIVASKLDASMLIILSDIDGLYDKNPNEYKDAKIIKEVRDICSIDEYCGASFTESTNFFCGTGGMKAKIEAAKIACRSGVDMYIANGLKKGVVLDIYAGLLDVGTHFCPVKRQISSKQKWIAFGKKIKGRLIIDEGAVEAVKYKNKSLLAAGIKFVEGNFREKEVVSICDISGKEIARGITNYSSNILSGIIGKKTSQIKDLFPNLDIDEVIHKDNLVIL